MPKRWKRRPEILLCPNIPQPLHGLAPRVVLGQSWWDKTRKASYAATNQHCHACGIHKEEAKFRQLLEGHELYATDYEKGKMTYVETVALCHCCHSFIHDGRLSGLLEKGEINHYKFQYIMSHGYSVLSDAGLHRPAKWVRDNDIIKRLKEGKCATWENWRLVLFGTEYHPKFNTFEDYKNHWGTNDNTFSGDASYHSR